MRQIALATIYQPPHIGTRALLRYWERNDQLRPRHDVFTRDALSPG